MASRVAQSVILKYVRNQPCYSFNSVSSLLLCRGGGVHPEPSQCSVKTCVLIRFPVFQLTAVVKSFVLNIPHHFAFLRCLFVMSCVKGFCLLFLLSVFVPFLLSLPPSFSLWSQMLNFLPKKNYLASLSSALLHVWIFFPLCGIQSLRSPALSNGLRYTPVLLGSCLFLDRASRARETNQEVCRNANFFGS